MDAVAMAGMFLKQQKETTRADLKMPSVSDLITFVVRKQQKETTSQKKC